MGYTQVALEDKILDMYPEIRENKLTPRMSFDAAKNSWVVKFLKDGKEATVYIDKADADGCMDNTYCEALKTDLCDVIKKFEKH
jgi:hypothetical protein